MKIGVLTFHSVENYGAFLQAKCLVEAIQQLGHECEIINYLSQEHGEAARFRPWVYRRPLKLWHDLGRHRAFARVQAARPLVPGETVWAASKINWNAYDAIVVGSDIVWNCNEDRYGADPVYFGRFSQPYRGRLVAYAPSIGAMPPHFAAPAWVAEGLRQFHFIGARDVNTQEFVRQQTGAAVPLVVDPTWLEAAAAPAVRYPRRIPREFLMVYAFPITGAMAAAIRAFAREEGLPTVATGYYQSWCDHNWGNVAPEEWVQLFHQARYVLSGTFHGTLYAIREQRPFCLLANTGSDDKVRTPLALTGLTNRHTNDPAAVAAIFRRPVDFAAVTAKLQEARRQSLALLKQALC